MVVERPYGMAARTKDMKATCKVDRLRAISGAYPRDSRIWSALVTSPLGNSALLFWEEPSFASGSL